MVVYMLTENHMFSPMLQQAPHDQQVGYDLYFAFVHKKLGIALAHVVINVSGPIGFCTF